MKKMVIPIVFLILLIFTIVGCSSQKPNIHNRQGFVRNQNMTGEQWSGRNLTEEERQKLFEEMQQKAIESCQDKNEGDACQLQGPRSESEGICKFQDEKLVCTINRSDRPMRQR